MFPKSWNSIEMDAKICGTVRAQKAVGPLIAKSIFGLDLIQ